MSRLVVLAGAGAAAAPGVLSRRPNGMDHAVSEAVLLPIGCPESGVLLEREPAEIVHG